MPRRRSKRLDLDLDGDLVIVGWGLQYLAPDRTACGPAGPATPGSAPRSHGRRVVYLGFLHSIWGDVAGRVVARLAELGARDVVYVGKVGSLTPGIEPNTWLATGNTSLVRRRARHVERLLRRLRRRPSRACTPASTSPRPSILLENRDWLAKHAERTPSSIRRSAPWGRQRARRGSDSATSTSFPTTSPATTPPTCPMSVTATSSAGAPSWSDQIRDIIADRLAARPI